MFICSYEAFSEKSFNSTWRVCPNFACECVGRSSTSRWIDRTWEETRSWLGALDALTGRQDAQRATHLFLSFVVLCPFMWTEKQWNIIRLRWATQRNKGTKKSGSAEEEQTSLSYPGVVHRRQHDVLAAELLEELCIILLLSGMRTTQDLLEGQWRVGEAKEFRCLKNSWSLGDSDTILCSTSAQTLLTTCLNDLVLTCFVSVHGVASIFVLFWCYVRGKKNRKKKEEE